MKKNESKRLSGSFRDFLAEPVRNGVYKEKEFHGRGQKIVNMGELFAYNFIADQEMKRVELNEKEIEKSLLQDGDLLFARRSLVLEGSGKCSLVTSLREPTTFESSIIRGRLNQEKADPRFFFYYFTSPKGRGSILAIASQTAVSGIKGSSLQEIEIDVPDLEEQKRIASVLATFDDLIENNIRRIKILKEMAQLIYREWFIHYRFPNHEKMKMVDSSTELGKVPEGWSVRTFGDITKSVRRNIPKGKLEQDAVYVGFEHIPRQSIALTDWEIVGELGSTKLGFLKGEILFGKIRPYFHKVVVAPCDGICSADIIVMKAIDEDHSPTALLCASSVEFVKYATTTSKGTKMPRADWHVLAKYLIALPDDKQLIVQFRSIVEPMIDLIQNLSTQNQKLKKMRDLLLPKLISGQLTVA